MLNLEKTKFVAKELILPILVFVGLVIFFSHIQHIPYTFDVKISLIVSYLAIIIGTMIFPLALIHLLYKNKSDFGIYFPKFADSFKLSIRAYSIGGPAGIIWVIIGFLGWGFKDWSGAITLSVVYLVVFYFVPKVTNKLPTRNNISIPNNHINVFVVLSLLTLVIAFFTYDSAPIIPKILYYVFIVGLGEELFFRGYLQSSFNRYFGKPFNIGNVRFGWGLFLAALLFGLTHALVTTPPTWTWALFTVMIGLTLGFIREKDGSILAAVLLHAMLDMPLVFFKSW